MNNTEKIITEIKEFHTDIEAWFRGKAENQDTLYEKLLSGFTEEFELVTGNGDTVTLASFSEWLPGAYGKFPDRIIVLENIDVHSTESHGLASYVEIQTTGDSITQRRSSAVFVIHENRALWLHLIEKWI